MEICRSAFVSFGMSMPLNLYWKATAFEALTENFAVPKGATNWFVGCEVMTGRPSAWDKNGTANTPRRKNTNFITVSLR